MSSVSKTDGEADVRVLGSQPSLSPNSFAGEEDCGKDVRIPRHQTVTESEEALSSLVDLSLPLAQTTYTGQQKKGNNERLKDGIKETDRWDNRSPWSQEQSEAGDFDVSQKMSSFIV